MSDTEPRMRPLPRSFYDASAEAVAPRLLGHWLVRRTKSGVCGGVIVETEAYLKNDPACHSFGGESKRNRAMFGPPGHAYVYLIYGMHYCFNTVCGPAGCAEAVLVRAIEPTFGAKQISVNRPGVRTPFQWTNGPARLCEALGIDRRFDMVDICDGDSELIVAENPARSGVIEDLGPVRSAVRIGITKAAELMLRFYLENSGYLSRKPKPEAAG